MTELSLSLALIAKNEARCLARCLSSARKIVNEIVVVDTGSSDETISIAKRFDATIAEFKWQDDFSAARNFALAQTTGNWILVLDADEEISPVLAHEIREFILSQKAVGRLKIVSDFRRGGQILKSRAFVSRLFPQGGHFEGRIHEQLRSPLPRLNLEGELWHDGYLESAKSDRNVKMLLHELESSPQDCYLLFQLALEYSSLNNPVEACNSLQKCFSLLRLNEPFAANAVVDYLYCLTELKRFEPALEVIQKSSITFDDFPDYHLACGLFYMNLVRSNSGKYIGYLPKIENSFKSAIAIGETSKYKSVAGAGSFLAQYNLGTLYHVFGNTAGARRCFEESAALGYQPAAEMLLRL